MCAWKIQSIRPIALLTYSWWYAMVSKTLHNSLTKCHSKISTCMEWGEAESVQQSYPLTNLFLTYSEWNVVKIRLCIIYQILHYQNTVRVHRNNFDWYYGHVSCLEKFEVSMTRTIYDIMVKICIFIILWYNSPRNSPQLVYMKDLWFKIMQPCQSIINKFILIHSIDYNI